MYMMQDVTGPVGDCMEGPGGPRGPSTFDTFKYKAEELATKLGLSEWSIEYKQEKLEEDVNVETRVEYMLRRATLVLNTSVEKHDSATYYATLAICNILLVDIDCTMQEAGISPTTRGATQNAVVRRLARVL